MGSICPFPHKNVSFRGKFNTRKTVKHSDNIYLRREKQTEQNKVEIQKKKIRKKQYQNSEQFAVLFNFNDIQIDGKNHFV